MPSAPLLPATLPPTALGTDLAIVVVGVANAVFAVAAEAPGLAVAVDRVFCDAPPTPSPCLAAGLVALTSPIEAQGVATSPVPPVSNV